MVLSCASLAVAEQQPGEPGGVQASPQTVNPAPKQLELEAVFKKMLSDATLEGSFTSTGVGSDPSKLSREKYTLGKVEKLPGNLWRIPARIQYGEKDFTIPLVLPVRWAGDTPVIVVDEVGLPGFGTVSARVMFFADHYAGYWKHGQNGGHLFGVITHEDKKASDPKKELPSGDSSAGEQIK
jgi:hypothetical protein